LGKSVRLEVSESFEQRPYRQCTEGLAIDGIPWIPVIGRNSFLRTTEPSPCHTHGGCIEIVYCRHGTCEYESCGETFQLRPGRVFVSRPSESHRMMSNPKGLATYYLLFKLPETRLSGLFGDEVHYIERKLRKVPRLFDGGARTGRDFVRLFRLVDQTFGDRSERRIRILNACLTLILSVIDASETPMSNGGPGRIRALSEEMRVHPERDYPVESLATRAGCSPSSLLNGFKSATGYTPHAYLVKCRIDRAKELLSAGDMNISGVASSLGFPSPQHFATQFRNATGMSPHEWAEGKK